MVLRCISLPFCQIFKYPKFRSVVLLRSSDIRITRLRLRAANSIKPRHYPAGSVAICNAYHLQPGYSNSRNYLHIPQLEE